MSNRPDFSQVTSEEEQQSLLTTNTQATIFAAGDDANILARRVRKTITCLFSLINCIIPEPVESEDVTRCDSPIITKEVVHYALEAARLAGGYEEERIEPHHVVYCTLRCVAVYKKEAEKDATWTTLMDLRALASQVLAKNLIQTFHDRHSLNVDVLLCKYHSEGERIASATNAIEIAIDVHATLFLADYEVQKCIEAIWDGTILQKEDNHGNTYFVRYEANLSSSMRRHIHTERLNVPRYQDAIRIFSFLCFLGLYTCVVNNRTDEPEFLEWIVYAYVLGYIFEEFRLLYEGGVFYLSNLWHWVDIVMHSLFIVSFGFRVAVLLTHNHDKLAWYDDTAYDVLSMLAIVLWVKAVSLLDGWKFFGNMIIVLQAMIKDSFMFFLLLPWIFVGFLQSFYALGGGADGNEEKGILVSFSMLSRAFLADVNFDMAKTYHPIYGEFLFGVYLFFTVILLLNILIALFNSSYVRITKEAEREYLALFTFKAFSFLKSPDEFPFPVPFNLIEVIIVLPTSIVLPPKAYIWLKQKILSGLLRIPLVLIAWQEVRQLRALAFRELDTSLHEQLKSDATEAQAQQMTRVFLPLKTIPDHNHTKIESFHQYKKRIDYVKDNEYYSLNQESTKGKEAPEASGKTSLEQETLLKEVLETLTCMERKQTTLENSMKELLQRLKSAN
ncbi:Calcium channel yvc1 [Basidiobolus ranarum]|uniref:Calcium channel yvc1 n=1 Tax=Basidiobolus ranarum TaxID=34480 RepID=A0ABR2WHA5_9FUNG